MNKDGLMSHETFIEMEKACNQEDGADCGDSMEKTLRDDIVAIDINAPQRPDLQQLTPKQIDEYCNEVADIALSGATG